MYKLLIVEDDKTITATMIKRLESWGMEARGISNFKEVMGEFSQFNPHMVLMDISLPFFNGYHWCNYVNRL